MRSHPHWAFADRAEQHPHEWMIFVVPHEACGGCNRLILKTFRTIRIYILILLQIRFAPAGRRGASRADKSIPSVRIVRMLVAFCSPSSPSVRLGPLHSTQQNPARHKQAPEILVGRLAQEIPRGFVECHSWSAPIHSSFSFLDVVVRYAVSQWLFWISNHQRVPVRLVST